MPLQGIASHSRRVLRHFDLELSNERAINVSKFHYSIKWDASWATECTNMFLLGQCPVGYPQLWFRVPPFTQSLLGPVRWLDVDGCHAAPTLNGHASSLF